MWQCGVATSQSLCNILGLVHITSISSEILEAAMFGSVEISCGYFPCSESGFWI